MAADLPGPTTPPSIRLTTPRSLRALGVLVLVMFVLTSAVGGSLALESSYLPITLASHIGLALVTLGIAGYATSSVGRSYRVGPRAFAGIAALAALGATIAGTIFLLGGQGDYALLGMEVLAGVGILAAIGMIALGGPSGKRAPAMGSPEAKATKTG